MADNPEGQGEQLPPKLNIDSDNASPDKPAEPPKTEAPISAEPPKVMATSPASASSTIKLQRKDFEPAKPRAPTVVAKETPMPASSEKRKTSRIPLESAVEVQAPVAKKAAGKSDTSRIPLEAALEPDKLTDKQTASKKDTSRIPLDAAAVSKAEGEAGKRKPKDPETIRIKPTETPGGVGLAEPGKMPAAGGIKAGAAEGMFESRKRKGLRFKAVSSALSKERVDGEGVDADRLAGDASTLKTIKVQKPKEAKKAALKAAPKKEPVKKAKAPTAVPHIAFILTSVAAVIVVGVLIYMLSSQVFGPPLSLTNHPYAGDSELPWPGKIPVMERP